MLTKVQETLGGLIIPRTFQDTPDNSASAVLAVRKKIHRVLFVRDVTVLVRYKKVSQMRKRRK